MCEDFSPPIVNISTPAVIDRFSRGFYQQDENLLYVPIYPGGDFFSYLDTTVEESDHRDNRSLFFDIDRAGNLTFIKLHMARKKWPIQDEIKAPQSILAADVRFKQFREQMSHFDLVTNREKNCLCLIFAPENEGGAVYRITDNLIIEMTGTSSMSRLWILDIVDDRCARQMSIWRKQIRAKTDSK